MVMHWRIQKRMERVKAVRVHIVAAISRMTASLSRGDQHNIRRIPHKTGTWKIEAQIQLWRCFGRFECLSHGRDIDLLSIRPSEIDV